MASSVKKAEAKAKQSKSKNSIEVFSWLKNLPVAPEYYPTIDEFQDPIGYIFKIEKEASKYGICKIIPPVCSASKKTVVFNLNQSILARCSNTNTKECPTFSTRQQQVGFSPRKHCPVKKHVWQSGESYTVSEFEAKAKLFEKNYLKKYANKALSGLEIETLYWKATLDKPISVEYANDMPGSAFVPLSGKKSGRVLGEGLTVGETAWNMRGVSRSDGSLLKFMKEEIPGVTSPMVYLAMLFSWFAWHVEDHDLHSLNYMHMGAGKTWYGVLREAAPAFEDVIRVQGYGGDINPLVTFATLGEKNTVMSPEVLVSAGVPCCRLVQNAGEFVVTFPGAYHSGFSHGFNCGEAANIATPEWVRLARDAAIRRASINLPPMVSHFQLLYDLALSLSSRVPMTKTPEPRSSRLKGKKKGDGEALVKELFVQDIVQNRELLHTLGKGSPVVLLPQDSTDNSIDKKSYDGYLMKEKSDMSLDLSSTDGKMKFFHEVKLDKKQRSKGSYSMKEKSPKSSGCIKPPLFGASNDETCAPQYENQSTNTEEKSHTQSDRLPNKGLFSCVTCGILCYACVAIVKPKEVTAHYLMSAKSSSISDWSTASTLDSKSLMPSCLNADTAEPTTSLGWMTKKTRNGLVDVPGESVERGLAETTEGSRKMNSHVDTQRDNSSLGLLALTYADSSDSDEDQIEAPVDAKTTDSLNFSAINELDSDNSDSPSHNYFSGPSDRCNISFPLRSCGDEVSLQNFDPYEEHGRTRADIENRSYQTSYRAVGSALAPMDNIIKSYASKTEEDSFRLHVFCLQHAVEVEQQLCSIGGVHMLLLCHPDYPKLQAEAIAMADELGSDSLWSDITFREATEDDKETIKAALESEESIHGNGDWAVKLGFNLYCSANLSRSPLYSQQMPYNSVIYNAFGCGSSDNNSAERKVSGKWSGRQKKIVVAGKWCGKVWMSNQVHPLLAGRDDEPEQERGFLVLPASEHPKVNSAKLEKPSKIHEIEIAPASSKVGKKRKSITEIKLASRTKSLKVEEPARAPDDAVDNKFVQQYKRKFRNKRKKEMKETPPPVDDCEQETERSTLHSDDDPEGGPSRRLRKRTSQPPADDITKLVETKSVSKKQAKNAKAKKAPNFKASSDNSNKNASDEEAEHACDVVGCTMSFISRQELTLHKQNICPVEKCRKKFFSHKYLLQHRRVHEEDRPLICPWKGCGVTFKWAWARTEHIRVHTGARPYICNVEGCGQTFRFVSDFSRHKRKTGHSPKKRKKQHLKR
ncbi:Lysine-specific demethylase REF6 [Heracleum sosnowskyi]|uniref:Lysine-specific demethylase REF6 n=1 Tax=Heracleum sosnowskyi TaxID=360622 RepID=A0AAD8M4U1_9APIA|nr:Lysine-specific demethylase REF6 [Heracleum sosnowskyi]